MTTETAKKQSNRAIQRTHATYKKKSEISEALNLIRPYVNESTYKFLSHFLHTGGSGVTQIKITEWCKKVGVSLGSYHKTIKPEIENTFSQSLIIKTDAPMKYDAKRKMKVKASEFKSLLPLSVLKHVVRLKESTEQKEEQEKFSMRIAIKNDIEITENEIEGEIESEIEGEIEYIASNPCESKDEATFSPQQNNSFREKHLEKSIYKNINNNNTPPTQSAEGGQFVPKIDFSKIDSKTMDLMSSYENFVDYPFYLEQQKNEQLRTKLIYWVQIAINKAEADINKPEHQHVIKEAVGTVICHYDLCEYSEDELTKLMYSSVKKILKQVITGEREIAATGERPKKNSSRPKYGKKPIRTEILPEWFEDDTEQRYGDNEQPKEATKEDWTEFQAIMNEIRAGQAESTL